MRIGAHGAVVAWHLSAVSAPERAIGIESGSNYGVMPPRSSAMRLIESPGATSSRRWPSITRPDWYAQFQRADETTEELLGSAAARSARYFFGLGLTALARAQPLSWVSIGSRPALCASAPLLR